MKPACAVDVPTLYFLLTLMRPKSSVTRIRSRMIGAASNESSHLAPASHVSSRHKTKTP